MGEQDSAELWQWFTLLWHCRSIIAEAEIGRDHGWMRDPEGCQHDCGSEWTAGKTHSFGRCMYCGLQLKAPRDRGWGYGYQFAAWRRYPQPDTLPALSTIAPAQDRPPTLAEARLAEIHRLAVAFGQARVHEVGTYSYELSDRALSALLTYLTPYLARVDGHA